jgi:hypothetical protein
MSIMKNPTGSTILDYDNFPVDNGYDYFLLFVCFLIVWWFVLNID